MRMKKSVLFSEQVLAFYDNLKPPAPMPRGFQVLYPFSDPGVKAVMQTFYQKYFHDTHPRILLLGINPGRFGAGVTGVNFTAPRQLREHCGIAHPLGDQSELSAEFIYKMIEACGGPDFFYRRFYIGAVSPLGYIHKGINTNYYDHPLLQQRVTPFMLDCIRQQLRMHVSRKTCVCIGEGKNYAFLEKWNRQEGWFDDIRPLPHPRFIMQYRRKQLATYLKNYVDLLQSLEP